MYEAGRHPAEFPKKFGAGGYQDDFSATSPPRRALDGDVHLDAHSGVSAADSPVPARSSSVERLLESSS